MLSKDNVKTQARKLVAALADHKGPVKYQDALELLALLNDFRDWKTMSAVLDRQVEPRQDEEPKEKSAYPAIVTPSGTYEQAEVPGTGFLYRVPVSVDTSMTALVVVRAIDREEAIDVARTFVAEGKARMEVDDGNYRGRVDYYCSDNENAFRVVEPPQGVASSHESGYQVGAFLVALSEIDDVMYADLTVYDPEQEDGYTFTALSCVDAAASDEKCLDFCRKVAELLHRAGKDVREMDMRTIERAFTHVAERGLSEKTENYVMRVLKG